MKQSNKYATNKETIFDDYLSYMHAIKAKEKYDSTHHQQKDTYAIPEKLEEYTLPEYQIYDNRSKKCVREFYIQASLFVDYEQYLRLKDSCTTNMPISCTNKRLLDIFGSYMNVSRGLKKLQYIGLIECCDSNYLYNQNNKNENCCKKYNYYYENEIKLRETIKGFGITKEEKEMYMGKNNNTLVNKFRFEGVYPELDKNKVIFGSGDLVKDLKKPDSISEEKFKTDLIQQLYINYPWFNDYQVRMQKVNNSYYSGMKQFYSRFEPNIEFDGNTVKKIGIRDTNSLVSAKKDDSYRELNRKYRRDILKKYHLNLHYDVKSSIYRISKSIYDFEWFSENVDLYELVYKRILLLKRERDSIENKDNTLVNKFVFDESTWSETREAIKFLTNKIIFESSGVIKAASNLGYAMRYTDEDTDTYYDVNMDRLREDVADLVDAVKYVIGGELFYSEIFFHESCIYFDVKEELLNRGYFIWQVYDSWYARKDGVTQEQYAKEVEEILTEKANNYIKMIFENGYQLPEWR